MSLSNKLGLTLLAATLSAPGALVMAQQQGDQAAEPAVEPEALAALEKMGQFLQTLQTFAVSADTTIDEVLDDNGQKIQFGSTVHFRVQRPDRLFAEVNSDRKQRQYIYDGKTVTVYAPQMQYYAVFDAPATIRETLDRAEDQYDINMPLDDLFTWGTDQADTEALTGAINIGPSTINGEICDHFAYRQEGADWQLWIRQGDQPLPCKLVITTTDEETQPQYSAVLNWDTAATFDDQTFTFTPPEGASQIKMTPTLAEQN